jgi:hypothetical protein
MRAKAAAAVELLAGVDGALGVDGFIFDILADVCIIDGPAVKLGAAEVYPIAGGNEEIDRDGLTGMVPGAGSKPANGSSGSYGCCGGNCCCRGCCCC